MRRQTKGAISPCNEKVFISFSLGYSINASRKCAQRIQIVSDMALCERMTFWQLKFCTFEVLQNRCEQVIRMLETCCNHERQLNYTNLQLRSNYSNIPDAFFIKKFKSSVQISVRAWVHLCFRLITC